MCSWCFPSKQISHFTWVLILHSFKHIISNLQPVITQNRLATILERGHLFAGIQKSSCVMFSKLVQFYFERIILFIFLAFFPLHFIKITINNCPHSPNKQHALSQRLRRDGLQLPFPDIWMIRSACAIHPGLLDSISATWCLQRSTEAHFQRLSGGLGIFSEMSISHLWQTQCRATNAKGCSGFGTLINASRSP